MHPRIRRIIYFQSDYLALLERQVNQFLDCLNEENTTQECLNVSVQVHETRQGDTWYIATLTISGPYLTPEQWEEFLMNAGQTPSIHPGSSDPESYV